VEGGGGGRSLVARGARACLAEGRGSEAGENDGDVHGRNGNKNGATVKRPSP